jgi:hypothetical protein
LEQYRCNVKDTNATSVQQELSRDCYPKVIITTRSELIESKKRVFGSSSESPGGPVQVLFKNAFHPLEGDSKKADSHVGTAYEGQQYEENSYVVHLQIASFANRFFTYVHSHVALQLRRMLEDKSALGFTLCPPGPLEDGEWKRGKGVECTKLAPEGGAQVSQAQTKENRDAQREARNSLFSHNSKENSDDWWALRESMINELMDLNGDTAVILRELVYAIGYEGEEDFKLKLRKVKELCEQNDKDRYTRDIWLFENYKKHFEAIPELKDLTTTPFMVEIITRILPQLSQLSSTEATLKEELFILLPDEDVAQAFWRRIDQLMDNRLREQASTSDNRVRDLQKLFDDDTQKASLENTMLTMADGLVELVKKEKKEHVVPSDRDNINAILLRVLKRKPVRRSQVYDKFIEEHFNREVEKRSTTGQRSGDEAKTDAAAFATKLAIKMIEENVSKVPVQPTSTLFKVESVWDEFTSTQNRNLVTAQQMAPLTRDRRVWSFIHKTVLEHQCATGMRDALSDMLRNLPPSIYKLINEEEDNAQDKVTQRVKDRVLSRLAQELSTSPWACLDIESEDAVRDFLVDMALDAPEFLTQIRFALYWSTSKKEVLHKSSEVDAQASSVKTNIESLLTGILPKRNGGTLLHTGYLQRHRTRHSLPCI